MKKFIYTAVLLFIYASSGTSAFEEDNTSSRGVSLGGAMTALSDEASTISYNPAAAGVMLADSSLKANIQFANKFKIPDYNLISGNIVFPKINVLKFKPGFTYIREGINDIILEQRLKFNFGTEPASIPFNKSARACFGFSINHYSLTSKGYQYDTGDPAVKDKSSIGVDGGLLIIKENLHIGLVLKNILFSKEIEIPVRYRIGLAYHFPNDASLFSIDFEPVKGINNFKREWFKIGKYEIGKEIYPLFSIGMEKIIQKVLYLRLGLKDFKMTAGLGIKIKRATVDYSFSPENTGTTHRIGMTLW